MKEGTFNSIGFIGCGNMGGALLAGLCQKFSQQYKFLAYVRNPKQFGLLEDLGVERCQSASELSSASDLVVIGVKPYQVKDLVGEISQSLAKETILLSIAAGISLDALRSYGANCQLVRCMPNTPAKVAKGVFAFAFDESIKEDLQAKIFDLFSGVGECFKMGEDKFPAFSALVGAGPAYVFAMMQALVQAGVTLGFGHSEARSMVEGLFEGSAIMAKLSSDHLMALRDQVLSPAGLTIFGTNTLDRAGLTGILVDGVLAAYERGKAMEG